MLLADYHTHSTFSHGTGTPEENVQFAIKQGLAKVAITDHGFGHLFYAMRPQKLLVLRKEVDRLNAVYGAKIQVLLGIEANLVGDGLTDLPQDTSLLDCILLGFHKGAKPKDAQGLAWFLGGGRSRRQARKNADAYIKAMETSKAICALSHPGTYIPVDVPHLARAAAQWNVALEINERHSEFSKEDLIAAKEAGASFLLSSDAHRPEQVGQIAKALARAQEAKVLDRVLNWKE